MTPKIILGALSTIAIMAGALAFKAEKNYNGSLYCTTKKCGEVTTEVVYTHTALSSLQLYCIATIDYPTTTTACTSISVIEDE